MYLLSTDASISAERLSEVFKEGREAMRAALRELKGYNMISSTFEHINGRVMTVNRLLGPEYWGPETRHLIPLYMQNSNLTLDINSFKHSKRVFGEAKWEEDVRDEWYEDTPKYLDPEEAAEFRRQNKEQKRATRKAQRQADFDKNMEAIRNRQPVDWTVDNAVYEFRNRMVRFDVQPWDGYKGIFKAIYAKNRITYETDGAVEAKMMDLFFERLSHRAGVKDPEMVWRSFIKEFGMLAREVKRLEVTPEMIADAEETFKKQMEYWESL